MSDIFISYAREDRARAERLAHAFEELGWSTFWDNRIAPGSEWEVHIAEKLEEARCIVVLWSAASVNSHWVRDEAGEGRDRKILIPVLIESSVRPPMGFRQIQTADLSEWSGNEPPPPVWQDLISEVEKRLGAPSAPDKALPTLIPSRQETSENGHPKKSAEQQIFELLDEFVKKRVGSPSAPRKPVPAPGEQATPDNRRPKKPFDRVPALQRIVEALDGFTDPQLFLAGNIPTGKLNYELAAYAANVKMTDILLLYDNMLPIGDQVDAVLLTSDAVHWGVPSSGPTVFKQFRYADIKEVRVGDHVLTQIEIDDRVYDLSKTKLVINGEEYYLKRGDSSAIATALAKVIRQMRDR